MRGRPAQDDSGGSSGSEFVSSSAEEETEHPHYSSRPVTCTLVLANLVWFVYMLGAQEHPWELAPLLQNPFVGPPISTLVDYGALSVPLMREQHQWWRLLSCCFVHAGVVHLFFNLASLQSLGCALEEEFGPCRLATLYACTGLFGSVVAAIFVKDQVTLGASGAIMGLFGGFWSTLVQISIYRGCRACCSHACRLLCSTAWLVLVSLLPMVNAWAHFGGLALGFLLGNVLLVHPVGYRPKLRKRQMLVRAVSCVCTALLAVAALGAFVGGGDIYEACPWCESLNCFETSFWSCCEFRGNTCAMLARTSPEGNSSYWLTCVDVRNISTSQLTERLPPEWFANRTLYGPYAQQPSRPQCNEKCCGAGAP